MKECSISRILEYIHCNYNKNITNIYLAELFHFHPDHLNRIIVAYTGMTMHQYILDLRIKEAVESILTTGRSVAQLSQMLGFDSVQHFSTTFKKKTGLSP